jgi:hypothetical protein
MKKNRVLTVELRLLNIDDEQYEACKELSTNLAKDLHATATLLLGGSSKPKVYHFGESYRVEVGKLIEAEQLKERIAEKDKSNEA